MVVVLVLVLDVRSAIGVSGVAVLTYYAITNAAALTLAESDRRWPRWVAVFGLVGCMVLIVALPPMVIATGVATLVLGALLRLVVTAIGRRGVDSP